MSDAHIRKQAIDPTKSFIVSAPAGSGKTSLLVQRYINLLCTVSKPEQVVAITFTRKAAAEMQNRVLEVIELADSTQPLSGHMLDNQILAKKLQQHAKKNHWNLINHNFRILTIDALNNRLLQHSPLGSGLGAEQDLNINAAPDYKLAIQSFLYANKNTVSQAAFSDLLQHCHNDMHAIEKLLSYMLQSREQWLPYIFYTQPEKMRHSLETALYNFNMLALSKLQECFDNKITTELLPLLRFASVHSACKILDDNLMLADFCVDNVELFKNISNIFLTKDDAWRKTVNTRQGFPTASADFTKAQCKHNKQQCMAFIDSQRDNKPLLQALVATRNLPPAKYSNEQWQVLSALIILLPELIAHLKVVFQKTGRSDYTERSLSAIYALNQNMQGIRAQSDADIEHILIDEFQDTSMAQYRLLYALTQDWDKNCNKTLFCVGDPMQSIYRFRQADVNLFINATQHGIANIQLQHLVLTQNFRSEPLLIDWVNQHMQHAFMQHGGAIKFNAAISSKPNSKQSYVNFEACTSADDEAQAILETINSIKTQDPDGKIAIIARNRRHLAHIVPLLQKNNISINAQELTPIAKQENIRHLHCLTAILLHPGDEIAWAGLLRSPLVACTLQDLYSIKQQQSLPMLLDKIPEQIDQTHRHGKKMKQRF